MEYKDIVKNKKRHPEINCVLEEMCEKIAIIFDTEIKKIILYGSYARGQETDESDIDIAIVLKAGHTEDQYDQMTDIVVDYELDLGITISIILIDYCEFMKWKATIPFYQNVEKDGIELWQEPMGMNR